MLGFLVIIFFVIKIILLYMAFVDREGSYKSDIKYQIYNEEFKIEGDLKTKL